MRLYDEDGFKANTCVVIDIDFVLKTNKSKFSNVDTFIYFDEYGFFFLKQIILKKKPKVIHVKYNIL